MSCYAYCRPLAQTIYIHTTGILKIKSCTLCAHTQAPPLLHTCLRPCTVTGQTLQTAHLLLPRCLVTRPVRQWMSVGYLSGSRHGLRGLALVLCLFVLLFDLCSMVDGMVSSGFTSPPESKSCGCFHIHRENKSFTSEAHM